MNDTNDMQHLRPVEMRAATPEMIAQRAETLRQSGVYAEAADLFTHLLVLKPKDAWTHAHRGAARLGMLIADGAIEDLEQALKLRPGYGWALAQKGEAYRIQALAHLFKGKKDSAEALWKSIHQSFDAYREALAVHSLSAWAYAHWGATCTLAYWVSHEESYAEQGCHHFIKACELNSSYAWAYAFHAFLLALRGSQYYPMVRQLLGSAQLYDVGHRLVILRGLSELECYDKMYDKAVRTGWAALQSDPEDFGARYFVAESLLQLKDPNATAFADATRVVLKTTQARITLMLGGLAALEGKTEEAKKALKALAEDADMETLVILERDHAWDSMRNDSEYLDIFNDIKVLKALKELK